jgi:hypothetical protein
MQLSITPYEGKNTSTPPFNSGPARLLAVVPFIEREEAVVLILLPLPPL